MIIALIKMILILLFISDFGLGVVNFKNSEHLKKINEELMAIVWHPKRWWNFCMSKDEKNEREHLVILAKNIIHEDLI